MTDSGNTTTTNLSPTPTPFETLIPNAEIPESSSSAAASPKSEGASTEPEPKAVAAATESSESSGGRSNGGEVVFVGRKNRAVSWGYSLNIGRRREMEDTLTIVPSFMQIPCASVGGCTAPECRYVTEESSVHYFGLYDGHGGSEVIISYY
ncbi:protein phosphatase 2C 53-like [Rosa chinensis]|uniref:protein phosphatase 2C 53-like n=1 Tax=Rosa chinensis TaxID=74649 RepID=UPI001AD8F593|nr:protein phosphatase 2C 53-like [Rosa chinensis]